MSEGYVEQILACDPPKGSGLVKTLLSILCGVSIIFLFIPYVGAFIMAAIIIFTIFKFRSYNYEYEYSFMSGELDVDKIIAKSKRKRMGTFDFNRMELVAPKGSQEALRLEHGQYKTFDYTSNKPDAEVYVGYAMNNNEIVRIYFEPNKKMLAALSYISPRKVII